MKGTKAFVLSVAIIIGVAIVIFGFMKYRQQQLVIQHKQQVMARFTNCKEIAKDNYIKMWNETCRIIMLGDHCPLPNEMSLRIDKAYRDAGRVCLEVYKAEIK